MLPIPPHIPPCPPSPSPTSVLGALPARDVPVVPSCNVLVQRPRAASSCNVPTAATGSVAPWLRRAAAPGGGDPGGPLCFGEETRREELTRPRATLLCKQSSRATHNPPCGARILVQRLPSCDASPRATHAAWLCATRALTTAALVQRLPSCNAQLLQERLLCNAHLVPRAHVQHSAPPCNACATDLCHGKPSAAPAVARAPLCDTLLCNTQALQYPTHNLTRRLSPCSGACATRALVQRAPSCNSHCCATRL